MTPLLEPETVATPLVKLIAVAVPKFTAVPDELVTVGVVRTDGGCTAEGEVVRARVTRCGVAVLVESRDGQVVAGARHRRGRGS